MKVIKYRAWDTVDKVMVPEAFFVGTTGIIVDLGKEYALVAEADRLIPLQYIGIEDKNGVEIYEGDIFIGPQTLCRPPGKTEVRRGIIKDIRLVFHMTANWIVEELEVIGNVYENPELLKEG